ncbi:MAG: hypothetical protein JXR83_12560 [Deltaproteobacteria bacterium]|nr:hypothetical protein [Deltaproteobacteria bacterium]
MTGAVVPGVRTASLAVLLAMAFLLSCGHAIKNVYPEQRSRLPDDKVRFNWEDDCQVVPWDGYIVQIALDPQFDRQQKKYLTAKPSVLIDVVDAFGPLQSSVVFWRVKARVGGLLWSDWSETFSFAYDGQAAEVRQAEASPPAVEVPQFLLYGHPESVSKDQTYSMSLAGKREIAARVFALRLWERTQFRLVERDNLVERDREAENLAPARTTYTVLDDRLNDVVALEEVLHWRTPDLYLMVDYYRQANQIFLLFARLVDVKSGVVVWHHLESLARERETPEVFGALFAPTCQAMATAIGSERSIALVDVHAHGMASRGLEDAALSYLLAHRSFDTLLRNPPVSKPVRLTRPLPGGAVEEVERTYYKLYDRQFSSIARSEQQFWPEADEHIALAFDGKTAALDSSLITSGRYSPEQLELFWRRPRRSISAMFVETRTGRIRSKVTIVAREDVSWSALAQKLAEVLTR